MFCSYLHGNRSHSAVFALVQFVGSHGDSEGNVPPVMDVSLDGCRLHTHPPMVSPAMHGAGTFFWPVLGPASVRSRLMLALP